MRCCCRLGVETGRRLVGELGDVVGPVLLERHAQLLTDLEAVAAEGAGVLVGGSPFELSLVVVDPQPGQRPGVGAVQLRVVFHGGRDRVGGATAEVALVEHPGKVRARVDLVEDLQLRGVGDVVAQVGQRWLPAVAMDLARRQARGFECVSHVAPSPGQEPSDEPPRPSGPAVRLRPNSLPGGGGDRQPRSGPATLRREVQAASLATCTAYPMRSPGTPRTRRRARGS